MSTLKAVRAAAAKIGAIVEDDKIGISHECRVEAPRGRVWSADTIHELVASGYTAKGQGPDYVDLLDRMAYGVEPCTNSECEWCHPEEDAA